MIGLNQWTRMPSVAPTPPDAHPLYAPQLHAKARTLLPLLGVVYELETPQRSSERRADPPGPVPFTETATGQGGSPGPG
jgi:hypothetical protein